MCWVFYTFLMVETPTHLACVTSKFGYGPQSVPTRCRSIAKITDRKSSDGNTWTLRSYA